MFPARIYKGRLNLGEKKVHNRNDDPSVLDAIRSITDERPSYGYRRVTAVLSKKLQKPVNHKRVYRIMKENSLLLQKYGKRPTRSHHGKIITLASNMRWCSDGFRILCWNGKHVEVAFSLDCCDREAISWVCSTRGIDSELVRDLMTMSVETRLGPIKRLPHTIQWLTDNGPGYVANKTVSFGRSLGFDVVTTPSYSPESNGMAEAFVKTFKRDYVYHADLSSVETVIRQLSGWFEDYNENHPHKGLGMMSPREYRRILTAN